MNILRKTVEAELPVGAVIEEAHTETTSFGRVTFFVVYRLPNGEVRRKRFKQADILNLMFTALLVD